MSIRNLSRLLINANSRFYGLRVSTSNFSSAASEPQEQATNASIDEPINIQNPFKKEKLECLLCKHNIVPDYKNVRLLSQFQSPHTGRIYGRHITGLCRRKQKEVETEIGRAQSAGLMPYMFKHVEFVKDPKLYDPERPIRPHKY